MGYRATVPSSTAAILCDVSVGGSAQVANLFPKDELDMMVNDIRPVAKKADPGFVDTWDNLYDSLCVVSIPMRRSPSVQSHVRTMGDLVEAVLAYLTPSVRRFCRYTFFLDRARKNLHLALCFSPVSFNSPSTSQLRSMCACVFALRWATSSRLERASSQDSCPVARSTGSCRGPMRPCAPSRRCPRVSLPICISEYP
jgi:hypothetical protein